MRGNSSVLDITSRFHLGVFKTKLASWAANNVWREVAAWGHRRPSLPARAVLQYNELLLSRLLSGGIRPRSDISSQKKKSWSFSLRSCLPNWVLSAWRRLFPWYIPRWGRTGGPWPILVFGGMNQFLPLSAGVYTRLGSSPDKSPPAFIKNCPKAN